MVLALTSDMYLAYIGMSYNKVGIHRSIPSFIVISLNIIESNSLVTAALQSRPLSASG
jgi:hypothetical protein